MPHLAVFRRGWENEHLAAFILSKFAFVAHPSKIGDDVGTDFFCTFFETVNQEGRDYLVPTNSFAIQVKSSGNSIDFTNQIQYLFRLELPFFIGIVDQINSELSIYSGEYLSIFFSHKGVPASLILELCGEYNFQPEDYFKKIRDGAYSLKCPQISKISTAMTNDELARETDRLKAVAARIRRSISSRINSEFIFDMGKRDEGHMVLIMAGPGSAKVFRENFNKRLAEVFHNLHWIASQPTGNLDENEFRFYEKIYNEIREREGDLPPYLMGIEKIVEELKAKFSPT